MNTYACGFCDKTFTSPGALGGHRNWCKLNLRITEETKKERHAKFASKGRDAQHKPRFIVKFPCAKCGVEFELEVNQGQLDKSKHRKHCVRSCANARVQTQEIRGKKSATLKDGYDSGRFQSI